MSLGAHVAGDSQSYAVQAVEYTTEDERPVTHLVCRNPEGYREHIEVIGHRPSFFVASEEYDTTVLNDPRVSTVSHTDHDGAAYTALDGTTLVRVFTTVPEHVSDLREQFSDTWEADVLYPHRVLIDTGIETAFQIADISDGCPEDRPSYARLIHKSGLPSLVDDSNLTPSEGDRRVHVDQLRAAEPTDVNPTVCYVDIEVDTPDDGGFPEPERAKQPVTAISATCSGEAETRTWVLSASEWDEGAHLRVSDMTGVKIFSDESQLLDSFNHWVAEQEADVLSGWGSDGFDYPYLLNRCAELSVWSFYEWSPLGNAYVTRNGRPVVDGVELFDLLDGYKKTQIHDLKEYTLDHVASTELGFGKEDLDLGYGQAWRDAPVQFVEYNRRDVDALTGIEQSQEIFDLYDNLRELTGAFYTDCHTNIDMLDVLYLRKARRENTRLPTSTPVPDEDKWYFGACFTPDTEVLTPTGIHNIRDLAVGDMVYSFNKETNTVEEKPVVETMEYPDYDGELTTIQSDHIDFSVTPNHRMLVDSSNGGAKSVGDYDFVEAQDLAEYRQYAMPRNWDYEHGDIELIDLAEYVPDDEFEITEDSVVYERTGYERGRYIDSSDAANFIGWYVAEGNVTVGGSDHTASHKVTITQQNPDNQDEIWQIFESVTDGVYKSDDRHFHSTDHALGYFAMACGNGSENKHLPNVVWDMCKEDKERVHRTMCLGDGDSTRERYNTISDDLRDDFLKLTVELGGQPRYVTWERDIENHADKHVAYYNDTQNNFTMYRNGGEDTAEDGVYCVEVKDNNTLLAGRNGKFQWVGNSVLNSEPGLHKHVTYPDVASMYPSAMSTLNISPETYVGTADDVRASNHDFGDCVNSYVDQRPVKIVESGASYKPYTDGTYKAVRRRKSDGSIQTVWYDDPEYTEVYYLKPSVKEGFTTSLVNELLELKEQYRGTPKYEAVKRITNSTYGVMSDSNSYGKGFRLFGNHLGESTTLAGRKIIHHAADEYVSYINREHVSGDDPEARVILGDTDSCATTLPFVSDREEALAVSQDAAEYVNESYREFALDEFGVETDSFKIEVESYARRCLVPEPKRGMVKKRYATLIEWDDDGGWLDEPELNIKGFEAIRSDVANITVDVQTFVLRTVLEDGADTDVRSRVYSKIRETIDDIEHGDVALSDLGISKGMSKQPEEYGSATQTPLPTYRGAKWVDEHFPWENITEGSKPILLYVSDVGGYPEVYEAETAEDGQEVDAIAVEEPERVPSDVEVDHDRMIQKTLKRPLDNIFRCLNWAWSDAIASDGREQTGLDSFM